jgi:dTDP-L-rhamnose 4-epimerase
VLITGGAGFVGSHVADELLEHGYRVRVLDNLTAQVHGEAADFPDYLDRRVDTVRGDVREEQALVEALRGVDVVLHLAAVVGVAQSMSEIERYVDVNTRGTATLLEALARSRVARLVVASSMSIYGEGLYRRSDGTPANSSPRTTEQLKAGDWELQDENGQVLQPAATPEWKIAEPASVYALTKHDQERLCLLFGRAHGIPTIALRFFNIYGPRQALTNPYTGVLAIFASAYLRGEAPEIFEDGEQQRDFVSVHDVKRACRLAIESGDAVGHALNIASGRAHRVREVARQIGSLLASPVEARITHRFRPGDIRHCLADISAARALLGYEPRVGLDEGLGELVGWLHDQEVPASASRKAATVSH